MKVIILCVVASIMFVAADAAYGLGGGGHNGDGRQAFSQRAGNDCAITINREESVLSVPEPLAVLLLGLGILGLAGLTRKFRSYR